MISKKNQAIINLNQDYQSSMEIIASAVSARILIIISIFFKPALETLMIPKPII